jgi:abhydrolase domain-containing protein 6
VVAVMLTWGIFSYTPRLILKWATNSDRVAAGLHVGRVRVGDHEIVYLEGGRGDNVVMLHGFGANKDNWTHFARYISPKYHVVVLDLPGFGESTFVERDTYRIVDQAKRLDEFANALGLQRFHLIGNSMGGHIAGRYALMFPEKVLTLGLVDSVGVASPVLSTMQQRVRATKGQWNPLIVTSVEEFDQRTRLASAKVPHIPGFIKRVLVADAQRHQASNRAIYQQMSPDRFALEPDLPQIKVRTLVLWGDSDQLVDVSTTRVLAQGLPNSSLVIMKDCGHVPIFEQPQEAARHYLAFLAAKHE